MNYHHTIIEQIELHAVAGIRACFEHGVSPNDVYNHEPLIYELISEYTRTPRFKECVQVFVDYGLAFEDKTLLAVLLDDASLLEDELNRNPEAIDKKYTIRCAYTPLYQASLLHICAEFNHVACAEMLVQKGADINARAGTDAHGFGGQTPIFHTVNQNSNHSTDMLNFLLSRSADLTTMVRGLVWGKGYPWETFIPDVTPLSYAMMGLLPQMHRSEVVIAKVVSLLLKAAYGIDYTLPNVPNAYLR